MSANVKTAISLQEELFNHVNKLAGELHISRSKLFVIAVEDFIRKNENQRLLVKINNAFSDNIDAEEIEVQKLMKNKLSDIVKREPW
jgi:metal-responsive CopG/Arc/MetJ family transcriptional regulator